MLIAEAKEGSAEVLFLGGEECVPVLEWDGKVMASEKGPLARLLQDYLHGFTKQEELAAHRIKV